MVNTMYMHLLGEEWPVDVLPSLNSRKVLHGEKILLGSGTEVHLH